MINIINKYLFQHSSINIPGLGTIFIERLPARSDFANKQLLPPQYIFRFNKYYDAPDKEFFTYLSLQQNIPDYEAIRLYNQFSQELRTSIMLEESVEWKDVGILRKNNSGEIEFEQLNRQVDLYKPVNAERVIRNNSAHSILVGDREKTNIEMRGSLKGKSNILAEKRSWWIVGLILSAFALMILLFNFFKHGFKWKSISNRQSIEIIQPAQRK